MSSAKSRIALLSTSLWWGSLTTIGFIVVPMLFQHLQTKQMAGQMAAQLFRSQAYVTWLCALVLLYIDVNQDSKIGQPWRWKNHSFLLMGVAFSIIVFAIVAPQIAARQNLKLWHSMGTALFAGQWLCASVLLIRRAQ